jgi:hypothetical protein
MHDSYLEYLEDLDDIEFMIISAVSEYQHIIKSDGSLSAPLCEEDEEMSRLITHKRIDLLYHVAPKLS